MNSMQSETSLKKSQFVFIAAENRRDCFNVRRRQWLTSFPSLSFSFAVSTSFFETFSYSAFNYLHFPIKFRLSMLHCFAPRRQSLELKFQTRHLFITRHPNRKKESLRVTKTSIHLTAVAEKRGEDSSHPRCSAWRLICIASANVALIEAELRRLRVIY